MNRRSFVIDTVRYLWLTALAAYMWFAWRGRKNPPQADCILPDGCMSCRSLAGCSLPQAARFRSKPDYIQN